MIEYDFATSLADSHNASDLPIWEQMYRQAFPEFSAMVDHRQNGDHQGVGIDRSVILQNSKQYLIDEKVRFRNKKSGDVYDDIALEYLWDEERRLPGWVCKPLQCDYVAYAIAPLGIGYLLPVVQMQLAWARRGEQWKQKYKCIRSANRCKRTGRKWTTLSSPIPPKILFQEMTACMQLSFQPIEDAKSVYDWIVSRGFEFYLDAEDSLFLAPREKITPQIRATVVKVKPDIIKLLKHQSPKQPVSHN